MKKVLVLLVALVMIATVFAGCGKEKPAETTAPAQTTTAAQGETTAAPAGNAGDLALPPWVPEGYSGSEKIEVWLGAGRLVKWLPRIAEEWKDLTGCEVVINHFPMDHYQETFRTSFASGAGPDIMHFFGFEMGGPYWDAGYLMDLTDWAEQWNWKDKFHPAALPPFTRDGCIYGMPNGGNAMALVYKKDLFEEHNISIPNTWEEFEELCIKFKEAGITPLGVGARDDWYLMRTTSFLFEYFLGPEGNDKLHVGHEPGWDTPEVVSAYKKLKQWSDDGWYPEGWLGLGQDECQNMLMRDEVAMVYVGNWLEGVLVESGEDPNDYDFFLPPTTENPADRRGSAFYSGFFVNDDSPVKMDALYFLEFFMDAETCKRNIDVVELPVATNGVYPDAEAHPLVYKFTKLMEEYNHFAPVDQTLPGEMYETWAYVQEAVAEGTMTPEEAAATMQQNCLDYRARRGLD